MGRFKGIFGPGLVVSRYLGGGGRGQGMGGGGSGNEERTLGKMCRPKGEQLAQPASRAFTA